MNYFFSFTCYFYFAEEDVFYVDLLNKNHPSQPFLYWFLSATNKSSTHLPCTIWVYWFCLVDKSRFWINYCHFASVLSIYVEFGYRGYEVAVKYFVHLLNTNRYTTIKDITYLSGSENFNLYLYWHNSDGFLNFQDYYHIHWKAQFCGRRCILCGSFEWSIYQSKISLAEKFILCNLKNSFFLMLRVERQSS